MKRTGIYFLLGEDETAIEDTRLYIGETDDISTRLKQHDKSKDFWDRVVVATSKDSNITKAHARYLESRLITIAATADRSTIENIDRPPIPQLPEADQSDMEYFLDQLQVVFPVLGVNAIRIRKTNDLEHRPPLAKASYAALRARHQKLLADGTIEVHAGGALLTRDVAFSSPSGAGAVFTGSSCNGRTAWVMETNPSMSFGAWETQGTM